MMRNEQHEGWIMRNRQQVGWWMRCRQQMKWMSISSAYEYRLVHIVPT